MNFSPSLAKLLYMYKPSQQIGITFSPISLMYQDTFLLCRLSTRYIFHTTWEGIQEKLVFPSHEKHIRVIKLMTWGPHNKILHKYAS